MVSHICFAQGHSILRISFVVQYILRNPRPETRSRPKSGSQFISKYVETASGTTLVHVDHLSTPYTFCSFSNVVISVRNSKLNSKLRRKRSNPGPNAWKYAKCQEEPLSRNAAAKQGTNWEITYFVYF